MEQNVDPITGLISKPDPVGDYWKTYQPNPAFSKMVDRSSPIRQSDVHNTIFKPDAPNVAAWMNPDDMYEARAQQQSSGQKAINGTIKFVSKTALYTAGALVNLPVSIAETLAGNPRALIGDSSLVTGVMSLDEELAKIFPHYYTRRQQDSVLGGVGNFIFDTLFGAAAFTTAAVLTEVATAGMAKGLGAAGMFARLGYQAARSRGAVTGAANMAVKRAALTSKQYQLGKGVDTALTALRQLQTGSAWEATIEAQDFANQAVENFSQEFYKNNNRKPNAKEIDNFKKSISGAANAVFATNLAIVGASNAIAFGRVFNYGLKGTKGMVDPLAGNIFRSSATQYKNTLANLSKANKNVRDGARAVASVLSEGFWEEGGQGITKNTALNYIAAGRDIEGNLETASLASSFTEALKHQFTTNEGWREMLAGMFIGGLGAPGISTNKDGKTKLWAGGFWEHIGGTSEEIAKTEKLLEYANNTAAAWEKISREYMLNKNMDEYLKSDDFFEAKNTEYLMFFNFVESKIRMGMYDDIHFQIDEIFEQMTDEEFSVAFSGHENMDKEEIKTKRKETSDKYKERAKIIRDAIRTSQVSDNDNINRAVAVNTAMAKNLDERYLELLLKLGGGEYIADPASIKALADLESMRNSDISKRDAELLKELNDLYYAVSKNSFLGESANVSELNRKIEKATKELAGLRKKYSKDKKKGLYAETATLEDYSKALGEAAKIDEKLRDKLNAVVNDVDFEKNREDLNRIAAKRRDIINQTNRLLSKEGKEEFINKSEELLGSMAQDSEDILNAYRRKIRESAVAQDSIKEKEDYQEKEMALIGQFMTDLLEAIDLNNNDKGSAPIDLGDTLLEKTIQDEVNAIQIPPDIDSNDMNLQLANLKEQRKALKRLIAVLDKHLKSKDLEEATDEVKTKVTKVLENKLENADKQLGIVEDSIDVIEALIEVSEKEAKAAVDHMFTKASKLFQIFNFTDYSAAYNLIRKYQSQSFKETGQYITIAQAMEEMTKNLSIRIDPYPENVDASIMTSKNSISYRRGIPVDINGELTLVTPTVLHVDPVTNEVIELGYVMNPRQLEKGGNPINFEEIAANKAMAINFFNSLLEQEITEEEAVKYANDMNGLALAFDNIIDDYKNKGVHNFSVSDLGLQASAAETYNLFYRIDNPPTVLEEVLKGGSQYVFEVNGERYIFAIKTSTTDGSMEDMQTGKVTEDGVEWLDQVGDPDVIALELDIADKYYNIKKGSEGEVLPIGPNYALVFKSDTNDYYYGTVLEDPSTKNMPEEEEDTLSEAMFAEFTEQMSLRLDTPLEEVKGHGLLGFKDNKNTSFHVRLAGTGTEKVNIRIATTRQGGHYRMGFRMSVPGDRKNDTFFFLPESYFLTMKNGVMYMYVSKSEKYTNPKGIPFAAGKKGEVGKGMEFVNSLMQGKSTLKEYLEAMHDAILAKKDGEVQNSSSNLIPINADFFKKKGTLLKAINRQIKKEALREGSKIGAFSNVSATGFAMNTKDSLEKALLAFVPTREIYLSPSVVVAKKQATPPKKYDKYEDIEQSVKDEILRVLRDSSYTGKINNKQHAAIYNNFKEDFDKEAKTPTDTFTDLGSIEEEDGFEVLGDFGIEEIITIQVTLNKTLGERSYYKDSEGNWYNIDEKGNSVLVTTKSHITKLDKALKDSAKPEAQSNEVIREDDEILFKINSLPAEVRLNVEKAIENLKRMFGDSVAVEDISNIVYNLAVKGEVWGSFKNGVIGLNYALAGKGTEYHEAFHKVFRTLLSDRQISAYLNMARKVYGNPTSEQLADLRLLYPKLSEKALENLWLEEMMADNFMGKADTLKEGFWKRLWRRVKSILGINNASEELDYLFSKIYNGGFKEVSPRYNIYSTSNLEVYSLTKKVHVFNKGALRLKESLNPAIENALLNTIYNRVSSQKIELGEDISLNDLIEGNIDLLSGVYSRFSKHLTKLDPQNTDAMLAEDIAQLLLNPENKEKIHKYVKDMLSKEIDTFEDELDNTQEEGNTDSKEVFKKDITIGGWKTASKRVKHYLAKVTVDSGFIFKNPNSIKAFNDGFNDLSMSVNVKSLYSQLLKLGTDTTKRKMLRKMKLMQSIDPNMDAFVKVFFEDIASELLKRGVDPQELSDGIENLSTSVLENSSTYNSILSEIYRSRITSYDLLFDSTGKGRLVISNNRNLANFVIKRWSIAYDRLNKTHEQALSELKSNYEITKNIYKTFQQNYLAAKDKENRAQVVASFVNDLQANLKNTFGIELSSKLLEYSVYSNLLDAKMPLEAEAYEMFDLLSGMSLTPLPADFITRLQEVKHSIYRDKDMNSVLDVDVSILKGLAESNAIFDPTVVPLVYTNIEGKTIYDIIYNNYNVARTLENQKREAISFYSELITANLDTDMEMLVDSLLEAFPDRFTSNPEEYIRSIKDNLLLELGGITTQEKIDALKDIFNQDFHLVFAGGLREREFEDNDAEDGESKELVEKATSKIARKAGKSYADADPKAKVFYLMALFADNIENAVKTKKVGNKTIETYLHKPHTPGDGSVIPLIRMPKYNSKKDVSKLLNIYKSEQRRIQATNQEIKNAYLELRDNNNPTPWLDLRMNAHFFEEGNIWTSYFYEENGDRVDFSVDKTNITNSLNNNIPRISKQLQGFKLFDMQNLEGLSEAEIVEGATPSKEDIQALFDNKYQTFVDEILIPLGLVQRKNDKLVSNNLPLDFYNQGVAENLDGSVGVRNEVIESKIKDFFISSWLNSFSFNHLLYGDPSRTAKDPVDFFKRIKKASGAGIQGGSGKSRILIMKDFPIEFKNNRGEVLKGEARTDAQTHSHILHMYNFSVKVIKGEDTDRAREIYSKLHRGYNLDKKDEKFLEDNYIQHQPAKTLGVSQTLYHKTSDSPIIRGEVAKTKRGTNFKELNRLYDVVEDIIFNDPSWWENPGKEAIVKDLYKEIHNYYEPISGREAGFNLLNYLEANGVQIAAFESSMKGSSFRINTMDADGSFYYYKDEKGSTPAFIEMYNRDILEILNTAGFKKKTTDGTQKIQIVFSEQEAATEVVVNGIKMTAGKAATLYREYLGKRALVGHEEKLREIKLLDTEGNITDKVNYKIVLDHIVSSLEQSNTDEHTLAFFQTSDSGSPEMKHSMSFPGIMPKAEAIISSMLSKNTLKHKVTGNKFSLASDWWLRVIRAADGNVIPKGKLKAGVEGVETNLEYGIKEDGNYYAEIILSEEYLNQYGYTYWDFINGRVPQRLLTFHGVRIPTQDKHSMANFKVVDFVSKSHGNVAIVPMQITLLAGSDFDIDALYTQAYAAWTKEVDSVKATTLYGDYLKVEKADDVAAAAENEYINANKSVLKKIYGKNKIVFPENLKTRALENWKAYQDGRYEDINPITREEANNFLLDLTMALSINDGNIDINYTPAETDTFKSLEKDYIKTGTLKDKRKFDGIHSPVDNIRAEMSIAHGQKNIGVVALINTVAQIAIRQGAVVQSQDNIFFGRSYSLVNQMEGRVNALIDELTTVSTDDLKLQYSIQFNLNTVAMAVTANLGLFGVPKELAIILNRNPLVHEAIINSKEYGSELLKDSSAEKKPELFTALELLRDKFINESSEEQGIGLDYFTAISTQERLNEVLSEVTEIFSKLENDVEIKDLSDKERAILFTHAQMVRDAQAIAARMANVSQVMQLIKGTDSSLDDAMQIYEMLEDLGYKISRPSNGSINVVKLDDRKELMYVKGILNDPFIKSELSVFDKIMSNDAGNFIISRTKLYDAIIRDLLKAYSSDSKKFNDIRKMISNRLISFLVVQATKNNVETYRDADLSLILQRGDLEGRERINELQKLLKEVSSYPELKDNLLLKSILGSRVQDYTKADKTTHSAYGYTAHYIEGDTRSIKDPIYLNQLLNDFTNLLLIDNIAPEKKAKVRQLASKLIKYHMVKDGLLFNNNSIAKQIHPDIMSASMGMLKRIEKAFQREDLKELEDIYGKPLNEVINDFVNSVMRQTDKMHMVKATTSGVIKKYTEKNSGIVDTFGGGTINFKINEVLDEDEPSKDLGEMAFILESPIRKDSYKGPNGPVKRLSLSFPKYFKKIVFATGQSPYTMYYEIATYETKILYKNNKGVLSDINIQLDANDRIIPNQSTNSEFYRDLFAKYDGRTIDEFLKDNANLSAMYPQSSAYKQGTEVMYKLAEVINFNEVNLAAATKEQIDMLKKLPKAARERINTTPYMGEDAAVEEAPLQDEITEELPAKKESMVEIYKGFWNREEVAKQTDKLFLFGDNLEDAKTGYIPSSTQAVIRGLPNAIGIPTKRNRGTNEGNKNVKFQEEPTTGYRNRTIKNASADATIAIAVHFNSAGEILTKSSVLNQNKKYIPIDISNIDNIILKEEVVERVVNELNSVNARSLNIAGNGIYTMKGKYTQQQLDGYVEALLTEVLNHPNLKNKIEYIRSGGQTGIDEAGIKAGIKLGLPTLTLAPKGWTFRDISGKDISNEQQFKARFNTANSSSYFTDEDFSEFKQYVDKAIQKAEKSGKTIVLPEDGIGTGKAMLKEKAPKLFEYLTKELDKLKKLSNTPTKGENISSTGSDFTSKAKALLAKKREQKDTFVNYTTNKAAAFTLMQAKNKAFTLLYEHNNTTYIVQKDTKANVNGIAISNTGKETVKTAESMSVLKSIITRDKFLSLPGEVFLQEDMNYTEDELHLIVKQRCK
jgi:hypothetical protein